MSTRPARPHLTLDRIYDEPNLSGISIGDIQWTPDGRMVSYLVGDAAGYELWGFDVGSKSRRRLFAFSRLPGASAVPLTSMRIRRAGRFGHAWRERRVPVAATPQYSWAPGGNSLLVQTSGGAAQLLDLKSDRLFPVGGAGGNVPINYAQFSPNGRFVSFVRNYDLALTDLTTGQSMAITSGSTEVMRSATPEPMGDLLVDTGHWWSPDSTRLAYLQTDESAVPFFPMPDLVSNSGAIEWERYPQAGQPNPIIALKVARAGGQIWIDTRAWLGDYLARVAWLPDSRHLLLQILNRPQNQLSLVLADSTTGATRIIFTETDPFWINIVDDLRFFSDGTRFLWSSERDSYRHLFIYDVSGKELAQLTSDREPCVAVEGLDEQNGAVYYLAFPGPSYTEGRLRRVSFRASARGYTATRPVDVTRTPGTHFAHLSPDCRLFANLTSTAVRPPHLDLCRSSDGRRLATIEENPCAPLAAVGLRPFEFHSIRAAKLGIPSDAMPLQLKLLKPARLEQGTKYPVIVYVYGGPLPGGFGLARNVLDYWRPVPELWMQMMAQRGFGVFSLDNRGSNAAPRGHAWETPISGRLGHVELADQLEGIKYLKSLPWVDSDRIGLLGGSFGGFMTLNAMLRAPGTFKAAVSFAPPADWREYDSVYTERYMKLPAENPGGYAEVALPQYAGSLAGKLLLVHGTADDNVHFELSMQMINAFIQTNRNLSFMAYPGLDHMSFFEMGQAPERLWHQITDFFEANL